MQKLITTVLMIALFSQASAGPVPQPPPLPPQLAPLAWSLGNWQCSGHYTELPPFTSAHDVNATFHVGPAVGDAWLLGHYVEIFSSNGVLQAIDDAFTIDALTGLGIRSFIDRNPGQFVGGFTIPDATTVHFTGTYHVHGGEVGFDEILTRGSGDTSFTTDSRVLLPVGPDGTLVPITFETQACTQLGGH